MAGCSKKNVYSEDLWTWAWKLPDQVDFDNLLDILHQFLEGGKNVENFINKCEQLNRQVSLALTRVDRYKQEVEKYTKTAGLANGWLDLIRQYKLVDKQQEKLLASTVEMMDVKIAANDKLIKVFKDLNMNDLTARLNGLSVYQTFIHRYREYIQFLKTNSPRSLVLLKSALQDVLNMEFMDHAFLTSCVLNLFECKELTSGSIMWELDEGLATLRKITADKIETLKAKEEGGVCTLLTELGATPEQLRTILIKSDKKSKKRKLPKDKKKTKKRREEEEAQTDISGEIYQTESIYDDKDMVAALEEDERSWQKDIY